MQLLWRKWRAFALREGRLVSGGHGRQYRQYRQFRQYRQRQWAGRRRLGTRPPTGYVPVPLARSPVIGAFAHLREVDLPRLGLSAEVVGEAMAVHAAVIGGAGSRAGGCGGTARPNPLPVGTLRGPSRGGSGARPSLANRPRRACAACPLSVSPRGREVWGWPSPTVTFDPRCLGSGRPQGGGRPYGEGIDSRGRRNDGDGRVFVEVSSGSGARPPQPPALDAPGGACPLSVSARGREVWGCPLPRSPLILVAWGAGGHKGGAAPTGRG